MSASLGRKEEKFSYALSIGGEKAGSNLTNGVNLGFC